MKIKYLGTAAAEGYPALFCECERCAKARFLGGKNIRTRSQSLIDGRLLIDWPRDAFYHSVRDGIDFTFIKSLLITHSHGDHFQPEDIAYRKKGFAYLKDAEPLTVYGSEDIAVVEKLAKPDGVYGVRAKVLEPFCVYNIEGYNITPMPATHGTEHPYIYIIEREGKAVLWAHDTGIFKPEVFEYIKNSGVKFSLVSLDCTAGSCAIDYDAHMNFERNLFIKEKLFDMGAADDKTVFVVNHFSHNGECTLYDDLSKAAEEMGMIASFDGMEIEI